VDFRVPQNRKHDCSADAHEVTVLVFAVTPRPGPNSMVKRATTPIPFSEIADLFMIAS